MTDQYISPLTLTPEQRQANLMALNARMMRAASKVAADRTQTAKVREAAARDAGTARRIAREVSR
jgi:hypothetical protein